MSIQDNSQTPTRGDDSHSSALPQGDGVESSRRLFHELANLLDGSLRNVGLALSELNTDDSPSGTSEPSDAVRRLQIADQSMRRMASLIQQGFDLKSDVSIHSVDQKLGDAVRQAVALFGAQAQAHGIEIHESVSDDVAGLPAGPAHTIITNALHNSIQAITDGSEDEGQAGSGGWEIELRVRAHGSQIEIRVSDTGPGLDSELVDATGRARVGQTTKPYGHGIGLQHCLDIVHALGGSIRLSNGSPRGAVLLVRYPKASVGQGGTDAGVGEKAD